MSNFTTIEWTEMTWNPTTGCTKISSGCNHCYAEVMARRLQSMGAKGYENRSEGLSRLDYLKCSNANIKFISFEPLLENLGDIDLRGIDWVIVGGESGPKARPMKTEWVLKIKDQCEQTHTKFFFKQWGVWGSDGIKRSKKENGRLLLGKTWDNQPVPNLL